MNAASRNVRNNQITGPQIPFSGTVSEINTLLNSLMFIPQAGVNQLVQVTATAVDVNGGAVTYSLTNDAGGRFQINPATGAVSVNNAALLNFESAQSHTITVRASDRNASSTTQDFTIAVRNVAPSLPADNHPSANAVSERTTIGALVGITASATDVNGGTVTYSLTNDAGGRFQINPTTGVVSVKNAEMLHLDGGLNRTITVQASDGTNTSSTDFVIAVSPASGTQGFTTFEQSPDGTLTLASTRRSFADRITLAKSGNYIRFTDPNARFGIVPGIGNPSASQVDLLAVKFASIRFDLRENADQVTLDFTNGNPVPSGGVFFDGGTASTDGLVIRNAGSQFTTTIIRPLSSSGGVIEFVTGSMRSTVSYTQLESVRFEGTQSENVTFDLSALDDVAVLANQGTANDGMMRLTVTGFLAADFNVTAIRTMTVRGNSGNDDVAVAGIDTLFTGRIVLEGGEGNDTLGSSSLTAGVSQFGGGGRDTLNGGLGDDLLDGGDGPDTVNGNSGHDTLLGRAGNDLIQGGAGNDTIDAGADSDTVYGGDDNDTIRGGDGIDTLYGVAGDDRVDGDAGNDAVYGGLGDDVLNGGDGNDSIYGAEGRDTITGGAGNDSIYGGDDNDIIKSEVGNDVVYGGLGDDIVLGGSGDDLINGDAGNDILSGGAGNDSLFGDAGHDAISGDLGNDQIRGGDGDDTLLGRVGADSHYGEAGNDGLIDGPDSDRDILDGGTSLAGGRDRINGQVLVDTILDDPTEIDLTFSFDFDQLIHGL